MAAAQNNRTKWIFVDLAHDFGGHEVMLLRWIEELRSIRRITPELICYRRSRLMTEANRIGVRTIAITPPDRCGKFGEMLVLLELFVRLLLFRIGGARLAVIAEGSLFAQRLGLYSARLSGIFTVMYVPLLMRFSVMNFPDAARLESRAKFFYARLPDAWVSISKPQAEEFIGWSETRRPVLVLPNTVAREIEDFGLPPGQSTPMQGSPMQILIFGRLDASQKGLDLVLNFIKEGHTRDWSIQLTFVGTGPYQSEIDAIRRSHKGVENIVRVLPWSAPLKTFGAYDALLLPSRFEGVPLVMLEAMAFGLPTVASDLPGTRAYLHPSCLFPVGDMERAFAILFKISKNDHAVRRMRCRNNAVFRKLASGAAFSRCVGILADDLDALATSSSPARLQR